MEEDKLLRRSRTQLDQEVGEGCGSMPIRDPDLKLLCSPKGSQGGHSHHSSRWGRLRDLHPVTTKPSAKRG